MWARLERAAAALETRLMDQDQMSALVEGAPDFIYRRAGALVQMACSPVGGYGGSVR